MSANASYRFLSYVRGGMSGLVSAVDNLGKGPPIPAVATVNISVPIAGADYQDTTQPPTTGVAANQVSLHGPGDITGLSAAQVIRTFPKAAATSAETTMFPLIEFDRPDLPWMFTPAQATPDHRLRPWLCLVVVERRDGVTFGPEPGRPLPVLTIEAPASVPAELPDPVDAWLWAHAQVIGQSGGQVESVLEHHSPLTLSRLIAPRNLMPDTDYLACVVPTFEVGRKAGLGETVTPADEAALLPAWTPASSSVRLPVYQQFTFSTAAAGDFESLAELLTPRQAPDTLGHQPMDVTHPGSGLPDIVPVDLQTDGAIFDLQGALRSPTYQTPAWPELVRKPYADRLTVDLNAAHERAKPSAAAPGGELTIGPPLYGQWLAAAPEIDGTEPQWLRELNLDPGNRVAAGLAAEVVDLDAEDLMASAWDQIGVVNDANRALRAAQLGREIAQRMFDRHVGPIVGGDALNATATVHSRVLIDATKTVATQIARSALPPAAATTAMRRVLRTQGPLARSWRLAGQSTITVTDRLGTGAMLASPNVINPDGAVSLSPPIPILGAQLAAQVAARLGTVSGATLSQQIDQHNAVIAAGPSMTARADAILTAAPSAFALKDAATEFAVQDKTAARSTAVRFLVNAGPVAHQPAPPVAHDSVDAVVVRGIAASFAASVAVAADAPARPAAPPLALAAVRSAISDGLRPEPNIVSRMNYRLNLDLKNRPGLGGLVLRDPLAGIMAAPVFTRPMYAALRDHFQEFLVPGLEAIPPNTITLVATNPVFVEAFMVGLNHEMARKLLWREYPTDQRGTYFKRFWGGTDDIGPIPAFDNAALGTHVAGGAEPHLVLLVRGELLRRYPNAIVYAVPAKSGSTPPEFDDNGIIMPIFRGSLRPDYTFIGFPMTEKQTRRGIPALNQDYWFVVAEHPTEPRFGLHNPQWTTPLATPRSPDDVTWAHVARTEKDLAALAYAPTSAAFGPLQGARLGPDPGALGVFYGQDAAGQAHVTFRNPVRVALHALDVLGPEHA